MTNKNFKEHAKKAMEEVVKNYQHNHPLYQPTRIEESIIDEEKQRAAFVLFEQIDTDRCTPEGHGWLGDQFRYSVWYIEGDAEPEQIYEDHDWYRPTVSALTGTRGRDPRIGLEKLLDDGVIARTTPKGTQDAYGSLSQVKVKITLDGKVEEPKDFMDQARNLVKRIGSKLGYDYLRSEKQLEGKNVAAIVWGTENGSTYGFDTVYLIWESREGGIEYKEITNSRSTKDYLSVDEIKEDTDNIIVKVNGIGYKISKVL